MNKTIPAALLAAMLAAAVPGCGGDNTDSIFRSPVAPTSTAGESPGAGRRNCGYNIDGFEFIEVNIDGFEFVEGDAPLSVETAALGRDCDPEVDASGRRPARPAQAPQAGGLGAMVIDSGRPIAGSSAASAGGAAENRADPQSLVLRGGGIRRATVGDPGEEETCYIWSVPEAELVSPAGGGNIGGTTPVRVNLFAPSEDGARASRCLENQTVGGIETDGSALAAAKNYKILEGQLVGGEWTPTTTEVSWITVNSTTTIPGTNYPGEVVAVEFVFTTAARVGADEVGVRAAFLEWKNIPEDVPNYPTVADNIKLVRVLQAPPLEALPCQINGVSTHDTDHYRWDDTRKGTTNHVTFIGTCTAESLKPRFSADWLSADSIIDTPWNAGPPVEQGRATVTIGPNSINDTLENRRASAEWRKGPVGDPGRAFFRQWVQQNIRSRPGDDLAILCYESSLGRSRIACPETVLPGEVVWLGYNYNRGNFRDPSAGVSTVIPDDPSPHKRYSDAECTIRNPISSGHNNSPVRTCPRSGRDREWWINLVRGAGTLSGNSRVLQWTAPEIALETTLRLAGRGWIASRSSRNRDGYYNFPRNESDMQSLTIDVRSNRPHSVSIACRTEQTAPGACTSYLRPGEDLYTYVDLYAIIKDEEGSSTGNANPEDDTHRVSWSQTGGFGTVGHETYDGASRPKYAWSPAGVEFEPGVTEKEFLVTAEVRDDRHTVTTTRRVRVVKAPPELSILGESVVEGGAAAVRVNLDQVVETDIPFTYWTEAETASRADFEHHAASQAVIPAGSTQIILEINTTSDLDVEEDETFRVGLRNPGGGARISEEAGVTTVTILDNDGKKPTVSFAGRARRSAWTYTVNEGSVASLPVNLSAASTRDASFWYSTEDGTAFRGADYYGYARHEPGIGTILAGETSTTISIETADDYIHEGNETFRVLLHAREGASPGDTTTAVVTITDDETEPPSLSVGDVTVAEGSTATVTVTLSDTSTSDVRFDYRTEDGTANQGSDYERTSGRATITAGDTTASITVPTIDDSADEQDETFSFVIGQARPLTAVGISDTTGVITITDDDDPAPAEKAPISIGDASVTEGGMATFTVTRGSPFTSSFTVTWGTATGTAGSDDFTAQTGQSLAFAANEASKTLSVQTTDDSTVEPDETFTVQLSLDTAAEALARLVDSTGTGTIRNDDQDTPAPTYQTSCATADMSQTVFEPGDLYCGQLHSAEDWTHFSSATRHAEPNVGYKPTVRQGYRLVTGTNRICAYKGKCARRWVTTNTVESNSDGDVWQWVSIDAQFR